MPVVCSACLKEIEDPAEAEEKHYLVEKTGQVVALRRHDGACSIDGGRNLRRVSRSDLKTLLSPASAMRNMLRYRRSRPTPKKFDVSDFRKLNQKAKAQ